MQETKKHVKRYHEWFNQQNPDCKATGQMTISSTTELQGRKKKVELKRLKRYIYKYNLWTYLDPDLNK